MTFELIQLDGKNEKEISEMINAMTAKELVAFCKENGIKPGRSKDYKHAAFRFCVETAAYLSVGNLR